MKSRRYWSAICVRGPRGSGVPEPERSWWVREPTWSSVLTWLSTSLNKYWRIPKHYKYSVHLTTTVLKCLQMCSLSEICSSISGRSGSWQILSNTRPPRLLTQNLVDTKARGFPTCLTLPHLLRVPCQVIWGLSACLRLCQKRSESNLNRKDKNSFLWVRKALGQQNSNKNIWTH